jgi:hypothetical protein
MRWLAALMLTVALACACGAIASAPPRPGVAQGSPAASASPAPTATPSTQGGSISAPSPSPRPNTTTPSSLAVLVDLFAGTGSYNIALVGPDANVVARTHGATRSPIADAIELPYAMTSRTRVYYLDGDQHVRYLKPDGTTGLVTTLPASAKIHAAFAVTPDDSRIAVALLDYSVSPVALTLYVEDIGGAHHSVIFTSTSKYLWPVVWHSGQLVVAYLGPNTSPFKSKTIFYSNRSLNDYPYGPNPYGGINFHVLNPVNAFRLAIISGGGASGLLTKAGTAVVQGDGDDWNGNWINFNSPNDYGSFSAAGSLSPDGTMIAACCPRPAASGPLVIWARNDQSRGLPVSVTSIDWVGWLDNSHLVTGFYQASDGTPSVVDINSNFVTPIDAHGIVAAIFPSDLES